jgi:23S rRNA (adenine-N6)-dimethyltransferase
VTRHPGRHELGQNLLADPSVTSAMVDVVAGWPCRPLLELGAGDGALTLALAALGRPLTAVELDPRRAARLRERLRGRAEVRHADMLATPLGTGADVVSNVPFGITTPLLRRLLAAGGWHHALLLVQWEVARKRAGVGGTTMLTAQWWPWYEFELVGRVAARSFRPRPAVDGGLLWLRRRPEPLVPDAERRAYQRLVGDVFSGPGRGAADVAARVVGRRTAKRWAARNAVPATALPRNLTPEAWAALHDAATRP